MYTNANLRVHLSHRGQAITGVEEWRVAVEARVDSIKWLKDRLPEPHRLAAEHGGEGDWWNLAWQSRRRALDLRFETMHRVRYRKFDMAGLRDGQTSGPPEEGEYNLAMNLYEIIDMVRWAVEGK